MKTLQKSAKRKLKSRKAEPNEVYYTEEQLRQYGATSFQAKALAGRTFLALPRWARRRIKRDRRNGQ